MQTNAFQSQTINSATEFENPIPRELTGHFSIDYQIQNSHSLLHLWVTKPLYLIATVVLYGVYGVANFCDKFLNLYFKNISIKIDKDTSIMMHTFNSDYCTRKF